MATMEPPDSKSSLSPGVKAASRTIMVLPNHCRPVWEDSIASWDTNRYTTSALSDSKVHTMEGVRQLPGL